MKRRFPYYPRGVFIKGTAQYDYFWKHDPTGGFENVDNFAWAADPWPESEHRLSGGIAVHLCDCKNRAKEFGYRELRFWNRIVGKLRSQAMTARASTLVRTVRDSDDCRLRLDCAGASFGQKSGAGRATGNLVKWRGNIETLDSRA